MYPLDNRVQQYAWGSRTAIAELLGHPSPSQDPQAELWLGAHPSAPSRVERGGRWQSLVDVIASAPNEELGAEVVSTFGASLPFLLKVLAAETPLSLQAHPNSRQARDGFDAEERASVPLDSPLRKYKDRSHKPELICALGPFDLLCGFRRAEDTARLLGALDIDALATNVTMLERDPTAASLRRLAAWLFSLREPLRSELAVSTREACARHAERGGEFTRECDWAVRIAAMYPGDIGVTMALLLNLMRLEAGQAVYLPAGNLHAYLKGVGIEIMANSDNVLRGGLTPKHVAVDELMRVLTFADGPVALVAPRDRGPEQVYETPAPEFRLSRIELRPSDGFHAAERRGPEILLCTEGSVSVSEGAGTRVSLPQALARGASLFVPASTGPYAMNGAGTVFRATVGSL